MEDNNEKKYVLNIYNTCTGRREDVEVNKEVYKAFKQSYWKEKNNDRSFYKHTYPISALEGANSQEERFEELTSKECPIEVLTEIKDELDSCLSMISETMRKRLLLYYSYGYSIKQIAEMDNVSFDAVKQSIMIGKEKIGKFFKGDSPN